MPYLKGDSMTSSTPGLVTKKPDLVPVGGKLQNRFYEPLVLLLAATQACLHHPPKAPEAVQERFTLTLEQLFHDFMNKLAQICDIKLGGTTVTAVIAIQHPDRVQFRFASNQRGEAELRRLKSFATDILDTLRDWTEESSLSSQASVLRKIVAFNRPRLQPYVNRVAVQSVKCLGTTGLASVVVEKLEMLRDLSKKANDKEIDEVSFFQNCFKLMESIKRLSNSRANRVFRDKANLTHTGEVSPWAELRHAAGRLLNYFEAAQTLIEVRSQPGWEGLFYDYEVVCIQSSQPILNPITRKKAGAAEILSRMASSPRDKANLASLQQDADELQRFGLDENIRAEISSKYFRPIVHAEILVHESVVNDPEVADFHSSKFFGGYRYIGTSKPTCRLCDYYFQIAGDGMQVRKTHRNLYRNWRAPDVWQGQGDIQGVFPWKRREDILNSMNVWIRRDTSRVLSDKVGESKRHDSNTSFTYQRGGLSAEYSSRADEDVEDEDIDDLVSTTGQLDLED